MDIKTMEELASKAYRKDGIDAGKLTLGQFIGLLEGAPASNRVYFDMLLDLVPTTLDSDRGSYDEIGLGYTLEDSCDEHPTVGGLLAHCKESIGKIFTGYKGGDYPVHEERLINMSNYGHTGLMIVGVESFSSMTTILTGEKE